MGQVFGVKLHQKSMRTSRIDRCEPRYAGTEFTNRVGVGWMPSGAVLLADEVTK